MCRTRKCSEVLACIMSTHKAQQPTCAPGPFLGPHPVGAGMQYRRATESTHAGRAPACLTLVIPQPQSFVAAWGQASFVKVRRGCRVPAQLKHITKRSKRNLLGFPQ